MDSSTVIVHEIKTGDSLFGLLYLDRSDPRIIVPRSADGPGWTLNLGQPVAWLLIVPLVALLARRVSRSIPRGSQG